MERDGSQHAAGCNFDRLAAQQLRRVQARRAGQGLDARGAAAARSEFDVRGHRLRAHDCSRRQREDPPHEPNGGLGWARDEVRMRPVYACDAACLLCRSHAHVGRYTSSSDCIMKTLRAEGACIAAAACRFAQALTPLAFVAGPLGLYKGFAAQVARIGPHTLISFIAFEQVRARLSPPPLSPSPHNCFCLCSCGAWAAFPPFELPLPCCFPCDDGACIVCIFRRRRSGARWLYALVFAVLALARHAAARAAASGRGWSTAACRCTSLHDVLARVRVLLRRN